jgi:pyridoxamine 5'-phosphate oxidase
MDINQKLQNLRVSYRLETLDIKDCRSNPIDQFNYWLNEAISSECDEPNAFTLSTVLNQKPRARVVLLKGIHEGEFVFYTNYLSAKGSELEANTYAAMTFLWLPLQRQVRIEGKIGKIEPTLSDDYFSKRPRGSQIGAIASPQSQKMASRQQLEKLFYDADEKFKNQEIIPRPAHWGGYSLRPQYIEFWQGRDNRLHDRIAYEQQEHGWVLNRLAP